MTKYASTRFFLRNNLFNCATTKKNFEKFEN